MNTQAIDISGADKELLALANNDINVYTDFLKRLEFELLKLKSTPEGRKKLKKAFGGN